MNAATNVTDASHDLAKAYTIIFREVPPNGSILIERDRLAASFRSRAYECRPDRAEELGRTPDDLKRELKNVALAFDYLADVLGEQKWVLVGPVLDENKIQPVRWLPPLAKKQATKPSPRSVAAQGTARKSEPNSLKAKIDRRRLNVNDVKEITGSEKRPASAMLGRYLHRRGLITLRQLIEAVAWQRSQRPMVGQIAKKWGILTETQVQQVITNKEQGELFCDYAVRTGMMTAFQRLAIVGRQRIMQKPIGDFFVENGILSKEEVDREAESARKLYARTSEVAK